MSLHSFFRSRDCHIRVYRLPYFPNSCASFSYVAFYCIFANFKEYPKDTNASLLARYLKHVFFPYSQKFNDNWHNLRSNYIREIGKSKEKKISWWGYSKRKMAILLHYEFFGVLYGRSAQGRVRS
jgi:hypothetical protein